MRSFHNVLGLVLATMLVLSCQGPLFLGTEMETSPEQLSGVLNDTGSLSLDRASARALETEANVARLADGIWIWSPSGHPRYEPNGYAFWIDFQVRNLDSAKDVRVLWTNNNWSTVNEVSASFEADLGDGWEQWGVDVQLPKTFGPESSLNIEYALVAEMNGEAHYDPGNNYYLGNLAGQQVKFLGGAVRDGAEGKVYGGLVTVQNLAYEKAVTVIWTVDAWSTVNQTPASYDSGNNWVFELPLPGTHSRTLEFALEYRTVGQVYYDNNRGNNYQYQIGPQPLLVYPHTDYLEGHEYISAYDLNINTLDSFQVSINGQEIELANSDYLRFYMNTLDYTPAESLELEVSVRDVHGFEAQFSRSFTTGRNIEPLAQAGEGELEWPFKSILRDGELFTVDYTLPVLHRWNGETGEETVYDLESSGRALDFLPDGRLAVLSGSTVRLYDGENFQVESSFTVGGLSIPVDLVTWENGEIWVASYVSKGAVRYNAEGEYLGFVSLPRFNVFRVINDELYLAYSWPSHTVLRLNQAGEILETLDFPGEDYPEMEYIRDIAVDGDRLVILHNAKVSVLDTQGNYLFKWTGYQPYYTEPTFGAFGSVITSVALDGDRLYVADFGISRIHSFQILD